MSDRPFETEPLRQALLERRRTLSGLSSVWVSTTRKSTSVPVSIRRCAAHVLVSFMAGFLDFDITVSLRGGLWRDAAPGAAVAVTTAVKEYDCAFARVG